MARASALLLLAASVALLAPAASALRHAANHSVAAKSAQEKSKFCIKDEIWIDGAKIAAGADIDGLLGCSEVPAGTSAIKVCGCGPKVVANLLTECQEYGKYSHTA